MNIVRSEAENDRELGEAARLVESSLLFGLLERAIAFGASQAAGSRMLQRVSQGGMAFSQLASVARSRVIGLALLSAAIVHVCLLPFVPGHLLPIMPFATPLIVALAAAFLILRRPPRAAPAGPDPVALG